MKTILIIDDSATVRTQVGGVLAGAGYGTAEAADGVDALARIEELGGVALAICDVNMPRSDGFDFLEKLRAHPDHAAVPVLMLTTEGQPESVARAKALGAKGWMVKPFKPTLLLSAVKKLAGE